MSLCFLWNRKNSGLDIILSPTLWQVNLWRLVILLHPRTEFHIIVRAWHSLMYPTVVPGFQSVHDPVPTLDDIYEDWGLR